MSSSRGKSVSDSLQMDRLDASIGTMVQYVQIMSVFQKSGETQALKSVLLMESLAPPTPGPAVLELFGSHRLFS